MPEIHRHAHAFWGLVVFHFCLGHRQPRYQPLAIRISIRRPQERLLGPKRAEEYSDCQYKLASMGIFGVDILRRVVSQGSDPW